MRTRQLRVGSVLVGGGAPISVQTMLNDDPHDAARLKQHLLSCQAAGADIVRLTVPDLEAARVLGEVRRACDLPLVADIHFDFQCALAALAAGADALRLNPGNIGGRDKVQAVARAAKERGVPIRIGVNLGSLEKDLDQSLRAKGDNPSPAAIAEALSTSALRHLKLLEDEGFYEVVLSAKASNVASTLATYRLLAERTDCPLHLGLTEAGTFFRGTVHSSVALGILLAEGIGDTIRVSLTDTPEQEVRVGQEILRSLGLRSGGVSVTSCPTCGRTKVNVKAVAEAIECELEKLIRRQPTRSLPHIAVMGCVVNGPGEAKGAELALCGGQGEFMLYDHGQAVGKVPEAEAVSAVLSRL